MGIKEIVSGLIGKKEQEDELPDDVTRDKYLRTLRRQRRTQLEEVEKETLKKKIAAYEKLRTKKHLFGVKGEIRPDRMIRKQIITKQIQRQRETILKQPSIILQQAYFKKKARQKALNDTKEWLGQTGL